MQQPFYRNLQDKNLQERNLQERSFQERNLQDRSFQDRNLQERSFQDRNLQDRNFQERNLQERGLGFQNNVQEKNDRNVLVAATLTNNSSQPDFDSLRIECLQNRVLYEDPDFPANDRSLYFSRLPPYGIKWMRPHDIAGQFGLKPQLFVSGAVRFDVRQGELGDCWVVAAVANISENPELLYRLVPRGQGFHDGWYAGVLKFQFWQYGKWTEVIIDDRLPTKNGEPVFIHSGRPNEFWAALVEKAYAKLHGSYEALKSGQVRDALTDFTGGLTESYRVRGKTADLPRNAINILFKSLERQSLVGCGIDPIDGTSGRVLSGGLAAGHAYSITDLREIRLVSDRGEIPITLVRIRNPWGTRVEWNGPWGDRSPEWNSIPPEDREAMGLVFRDDGEFWMDFRDFLENFDTLDICNLTPDSPLDTPRRWKVAQFHGRWQKGISSGGRPVMRDESGKLVISETHWTNPQYKVTLRDTDEDEDNLCSFIVELIQKDRRKLKHRGTKNVDIGFLVYKYSKEYPMPLPRAYFNLFGFVERCDYFSNTRQIVKRFLMEPGDYVVIPCTYEAHVEADFLLRVFFENDNFTVPTDEAAELTGPVPPAIDPTVKEGEEKFKRFFYESSGEDMMIDCYEFRRLINTALKSDPNHQDLGIDACKALLAIFDEDCSGKLGFFEFIQLWNMIKLWMTTYNNAEPGRTMLKLSAYQLRTVLQPLGFKFNSKVLSALVLRYSDEQYQISIDSFIMCMARITQLTKIFKAHQQNGKAVFSVDEWLQQGLLI
ncbi:calpain-9 isoform X1 [Lingula anatina]|uniref:Calpain-9 isoform X1 n=1 Tax=Lingula anatina TaxID=7574 RepID=A0A1S3J682_LINAN|nr:calpain-9 isoform X1 [Lingula anatina]|eukprot:XP_013405349.1 calpain-9 isoform X1 [Lingula anatina]